MERLAQGVPMHPTDVSAILRPIDDGLVAVGQVLKMPVLRCSTPGSRLSATTRSPVSISPVAP
jgi:hypothetical protein